MAASNMTVVSFSDLLHVNITEIKDICNEAIADSREVNNEIHHLKERLEALREEKRNTLIYIKELKEKLNNLELQDKELQEILFEKEVLEKSCDQLLKTVLKDSDKQKMEDIQKKYKLYKTFLRVRWDSKNMANKENIYGYIVNQNGKINTISMEKENCPNLVDAMWKEVEK